MPKKLLAETHPELAEQWHPTKNGRFLFDDKNLKKYIKYWWKCNLADDHEWKSNIYNRLDGKGCPVCAGQKVVTSNCLATTNPNLANEWHPIKNETLTPYGVSKKSNKSVWWKCDKGDDHEWQSKISNRSNGKGCPVCAGKKVVTSNCLATTHPKIAKQWHPTKNGNDNPKSFTDGSNKSVWWKCNKGDDHEWRTSIVNRTKRKSGCPVCGNDKIVTSNCLATTNPELLKEWHPTKNINITPYDVTKNSTVKIWWKCDKGYDHIWRTSPVMRKKTSCPVCSNQKTVTSNCLATTHPKIAKQWHPTKNGNLTPIDISAGSGKKVWWKCDKGEDHEWKTSSVKRLYGRNCPFCTLTPQSKQELTITFELMKLFKNIDPKGLKTKLEGRLRAIDIFIPKLNLCIEFDGSYWHKDKRDIDKIKSEMLFKEGFKLIRVREEPLKKIYDTDVISKNPYNGKQVTNDILSMIMSIFELDAKLVSKIKEYQSKEGLQNEKGLDRYIDKILTEKAEKKQLNIV